MPAGYEERFSHHYAYGGSRTVYSPQGPSKANHLLVVELPDGTTKTKEFGVWADVVNAASAPFEVLFPE